MKMKKRFLSILLSLVMVLGLMPGMSLTVYAETYDSFVDKLQTGDILEPGAMFDPMSKPIILQANGWCTSERYGSDEEITQGTENKTLENLIMLQVSREDDSLGAIGDMPDTYFPYANGAKAEAWIVVSVTGDTENQTVTLTGYAQTQSNNPFTSAVYYRRYDSNGVKQDNGTLAANAGILIERDTKKWADDRLSRESHRHSEPDPAGRREPYNKWRYRRQSGQYAEYLCGQHIRKHKWHRRIDCYRQ